GQRTPFLQAKQQVHSPERGRRKHDTTAPERPPRLTPKERSRWRGRDLVSVAPVRCAVDGANIHHAGFRKDLRATLFREVKVVLVQAVLGVEPAADHAAATSRARGALWPLAIEVRIGIGDAT